jgi:hypothetical protein
MADQFASLKSILSGDATLVALLTGGILDDTNTGADGVTQTYAQNNSLVNSTTGLLAPFAFIAWSTRTPQALNHADARGEDRFLFVYLYNDATNGYGTIETAANRVITLLNQVERTVDSQYTHVTRYVDGSPRTRDDNLFDAATLYLRFVDTFGR